MTDKRALRIAILTFVVVLLWQVQRELGLLTHDDI